MQFAVFFRIEEFLNLLFDYFRSGFRGVFPQYQEEGKRMVLGNRCKNWQNMTFPPKFWAFLNGWGWGYKSGGQIQIRMQNASELITTSRTLETNWRVGIMVLNWMVTQKALRAYDANSVIQIFRASLKILTIYQASFKKYI